MKRMLTVSTLALFCAPFAFAAFTADHHVPFTPENAIIGHFSPTNKPVLTMKSGETVTIDGGGGQRWGTEDANTWLKANKIPATVESNACIAETIKVLKETPRAEGIPNGHLLVGPVYIEEAEPGDTLEVRILSVVPRIPYGTVGGSPGRGGLPDLVPVPFNYVVMLDLPRNAGVFTEGVEVPLAPFMGVMATCPPDSEGAFRKSGPSRPIWRQP